MFIRCFTAYGDVKVLLNTNEIVEIHESPINTDGDICTMIVTKPRIYEGDDGLHSDLEGYYVLETLDELIDMLERNKQLILF